MMTKIKEFQIISQTILELDRLKLSQEQLEKYRDIDDNQSLEIDHWEILFKINPNLTPSQLMQDIKREVKLIESIKTQESKEKYISYFILNDWHILKDKENNFFVRVDPETKETNYYLHLNKDVKVYYLN